MIAIAWILYGFGISPAYYSWGQFAGYTIDELGLTRGQTGDVFGLFTFIYSAAGPLVGLSVGRFGLRLVITAGALTSACGFFLMSRADSLLDAYIAYAVLGGLGIGFSTILPAQTLATNWFVRYRARAIAIVMTAGGVVGFGVPLFDRWIAEGPGWRLGWVVIAGISLVLAVVAAIFVRSTPEELGAEPDGGAKPKQATSSAAMDAAARAEDWRVGTALRTPQFLALIIAGIAYAVPWGVVIAHGRLHLEDLGFSSAIIASIFSVMILISNVGRLSGSMGDFMRPQSVLGLALAVETAGLVALIYARGTVAAYAALICIGLGFGAAYITITVVFGHFFGRRPFATLAGTRMMITGVFNALGPGIAGRIFDASGSYDRAFWILVGLCGLGSVVSFLSKKPVPKEAALAASV